jgi:hypothetical protein
VLESQLCAPGRAAFDQRNRGRYTFNQKGQPRGMHTFARPLPRAVDELDGAREERVTDARVALCPHRIRRARDPCGGTPRAVVWLSIYFPATFTL